MTDNQIIEGLKLGHNVALKTLYLKYKDSFLAFAVKYNMPREELIDIYQDSVLAIRDNALRGNLDDLNSSLKTYLFSIGKYKIFNKLKAKKQWVTIKNTEHLEHITPPEHIDVSFDEPLNNNEQNLKNAFLRLGDKCKKILTLFYYQELSLDEIQKQLSYSNKDVLKSQKSRCLKTLKEKMKNGR